MTSSVHCVTLSCSDPYALAGFWAGALGGRLADDDAPGDPEALVIAGAVRVLCVQAEEVGAGPRVHLDLQPSSTRAQEVERLQGLGASVVTDRTRPDGTGWVVMADPEGVQFCVERSAAERGQAPRDAGERRMPFGGERHERALLLQMLDWYREGVRRKVDGLPDAAAQTSPLGSGTTVAGLVKHLAYVEDVWLSSRVDGRPEGEPWASAPWDDDRDWEFHSAASEPLTDSVALYDAACARSREVTARHDLDETFTLDDRVLTLRFVLLHLVEETARHLGHLDVLCELADGRTGE